MFEINENQKKRLDKWLEEQTKKNRTSKAAIGGEISYTFTPTTLGTVIKVTNSHTNEQIDLTEYELW